MRELPVAFYFEVVFQNAKIAFKEVSGLRSEIETEAISEGGVNDYVHILPKQIKHGNLVLKRALRAVDSSDVEWIKEIIEGDSFDKITTKDIVIHLLNHTKNPTHTWLCSGAYPVKWEVDTLDSEKNSILIETLEFSYKTLKRF